VLPVNEKAEEQKGYHVKNSQHDAFNTLLADMSQRLGIYFVNTAEAVTAKDSFTLPSGIANDGVHLNKSACDKVYDYLFTHTAGQTTVNK
jgi:lysophospholipase L1-like esterase